jgi:hypothetical protein
MPLIKVKENFQVTPTHLVLCQIALTDLPSNECGKIRFDQAIFWSGKA